MADIRTLMAQERQARRLNHEFASYSKSGALMCTACLLNVRSEALWEGHLRSANHKNNVQKLHESSRAAVKRKIEDLEEVEVVDDLDARKKLKPKTPTPVQVKSASVQATNTENEQPERARDQRGTLSPQSQEEVAVPAKATTPHLSQPESRRTVPIQAPAEPVDEDEWAAFEREVAPLAQADFSAATIIAAPVSAAQLEAESELDRKKLRDTEADDEKEDEGRRMEEEFDVMEEMEERVRKLKQRREALRHEDHTNTDTGQSEDTSSIKETLHSRAKAEESGEDSAEDADDWYS